MRMQSTGRILIVDDEEMLRIALFDELGEAGFNVTTSGQMEEAKHLISRQSFDVVVTDLRISGVDDGLQILEYAKQIDPEIAVVVMTAYASVANAVKAMKRGADDYLTKPFETDELLLVLNRLGKVARLRRENWHLREKLTEQNRFEKLVAVSKAMADVTKCLAIVSPTDETILLTGESGTGKELVARCIHENSARNAGPFVPISCAALSSELLESELFGHEKGSFTGATHRRIGRFERAAGGTLFLDEVDDIPLPLQVKLLRVLQEREFERIGSTEVIRADIRLIAATKTDLSREVANGRFREDLYYRLMVIPVNLPPLRKRREDIVPLTRHFLSLSCPTCDKVDITNETLLALEDYRWPGNVRELKNMISRLVILGQCKTITVEMVQSCLSDVNPGTVSLGDNCTKLDEAVANLERKLIFEALAKVGGNKSRAASLLGLKSSTFRDKLSKHFPDR